MRRTAIRVAILLYPADWRERYGTELEGHIDELRANRKISVGVLVLDLLVSGLCEQVRTAPRRVAPTVGTVGVATAAALVLGASLSSLPLPPRTARSHQLALATTPRTRRFRESSTRKTVEYNVSSGKVVWLARGTPAWRHDRWSLPGRAATIAGTYQPIHGS